MSQEEQPLLTLSTGDMWAELIDEAESWGGFGPILPLCRARRQVGIERYGVPLQAGNGRDNRRDLIEELLDAAVYAWAENEVTMALELLGMVRRLHQPAPIDPGQVHLFGGA